MEKDFFKSLKEIDQLLQNDPNSEVIISRLTILIRSNISLKQYCFDSLPNPDWLEPLWNIGFFKTPPLPEAIGTSTSFAPWPESRCLARMALQKPDLVMNIILQIPDNGNVWVYEDLVDAALKMPPEVSIRLLDKVKGWMQNPIPNMPLPTKLGDLVVYYAKGQQNAAAFELAGKLFEILPDPNWSEAVYDDPYGLPPEPKIKCNVWDYKENLKKCIPELCKLSGLKTLEFLCDLLDKAIKYSREKSEKDNIKDFSWFWQPAIEDHEQNHPYEFKSILVNQVRDTGEWLIDKGSYSIDDILKAFEKHQWKIFLRIELHLLRKFAEKAPKLVEKRLIDRKMFIDSAVYHEYTLLLQERFNLLSPEKQHVVLGWIDKGPDISKFKRYFKEEMKREPTSEEVSKRRRFWQFEWFFFIKDHLQGKYKKNYGKLHKEFGAPEYSGFRSYSSSWWGSTSPKDTQELQQMAVHDLIKYLQDWKPTNDPKSPSPEALGNTFTAVVTTSPQKYADDAIKFKSVYPIYVRSFLRGLYDALNQKSIFNWVPVLELCKWVIDQPIKITDKNILPEMEDDLDWGNTRNAIANLLSIGLEDRDGAISIEYRKTVWSILDPLTHDSEPTLEYEEKYGGSNIDPSTMSINTTRGEAMHAVIRYALWVRHDFEKSKDDMRIDGGFKEMPEVSQILEERLDISKEPTLTIRSVYGQWFPWLVYLDKEWAKVNADKIFPIDTANKDLFYASWDAYAIFCQAQDEVFDVIKNQYAYVVDNLGVDRTETRITNPDEKLAQHLMVLYWRGKIENDEPGGILQRFWKKASPQLRGQTLGFVGRALQNTSEDIPSKFLDRLKLLWQNRLNEAKNAGDLEICKEEIEAFSWWFLSGKFSDEWAIENLRKALRITGEIEMNHLVMEKLTKLVKTMPLEVVECLDLIVRGDRSRWTVLGISDYIRTILSEALKTKFASKAEEVVNNLLSQGHFGFRDLLENNGKK
ncbi:MAG: hypothetical protein MUO31_03310 [Thermodesulfovibrionales bacterium]|nr:hypothetical protein [Thermodesulfovibrionales bacterium]